MKCVLAIFVLGASLSACGGGASPTTPSVLPISPVPPGPPTTVLAVSLFTVTPIPPSQASDWIEYRVKLRLSETSGKSGATLKTITLSAAGTTDYGCGEVVGINPGETWDLDSLGYCAPGVSLHTVGASVSRVSLFVAFTDDEGRAGSLTTSVDVTK